MKSPLLPFAFVFTFLLLGGSQLHAQSNPEDPSSSESPLSGVVAWIKDLKEDGVGSGRVNHQQWYPDVNINKAAAQYAPNRQAIPYNAAVIDALNRFSGNQRISKPKRKYRRFRRNHSSY